MPPRKNPHENPFAPLRSTDSPLQCLLGRNDHSQVVLSLLSKYTYPIQTPYAMDALAGTSVQMLPSDLCAWKPGSQLIIAGSAHAPWGKSEQEMRVEIHSASLHHEILVIGCRHTVRQGSGLRFTEPRPFRRVPLALGLAFGGESQGLGFPPNPIGLGFLLYGPQRTLAHNPLPCLENPQHRLEPDHLGLDWNEWHRLPRPMHCGYVPSQFHPRSRWHRRIHPDPRWHFSTHSGLTSPTHFAEGENIELRNIHPHHRLLTVQLPRHPPGVWTHLDGNAYGKRMHIQDVQLDPVANRMSIVWCAHFLVLNENALLNANLLQFGMLTPEQA